MLHIIFSDRTLGGGTNFREKCQKNIFELSSIHFFDDDKFGSNVDTVSVFKENLKLCAAGKMIEPRTRVMIMMKAYLRKKNQ